MISDISLPFISYSDISPLILSYFLSYQSLIITFFYPTHPTMTHDLTIFSIRRRCRSVLDHLGCVFIHSFQLYVQHLPWWQGLADCWLISDDAFILIVGTMSVVFCLLFSFWALVVIIVIIHQLVLFCQHGVTIHGPIWHYPSEVGHFHYMMDEHISKYSSFEAFCISVCSSLHTGAYPFSLDH